MPKIVKINRTDPPDLLKDFKAFEITPRSGDVAGSAQKLNYSSAQNLMLWTRFSENQPTNLTTDSAVSSLEYIGGENTKTQGVYSSLMKTALFTSGSSEKQATRSAVITFPSTTNVTAFGDGTAASQSPFSVSLWFKKNKPQSDDSTDDFFFAKGLAKSPGGSTYDNSEYAALLQTNGKLKFYLADASARALQFVESDTDTGINADFNTWHHIVLTYDGTPGTRADANTANAGMKIYLDGSLHATTQGRIHDGSGYEGMEKKSNKIFIGSNDGGVSGDADLVIAEFALWNTTLGIEAVKAIYHYTHENSVVKSGYLDNSARIKIREKDNRPNCYPTHHRMGDKDRSGKRKIFFDDKALNFKQTIFDNFSGSINSKVWESGGGEIRKNYDSDGNVVDRCFTFQGAGKFDGSSFKRFLRSRAKINNPVKFNFNVVRGTIDGGSVFDNPLDLKYQPDPDNIFKLMLQISTDTSFTSPVTIATASFQETAQSFYNLPSSNLALFPLRSKRFNLSLEDFPNLGGGYYFRFVQETYEAAFANWAIREIDIEYYDTQVNYPLLVDTNNDPAGIAIRKKAIASQNIMSTISGSGRYLSGISDIISPLSEQSENISAFNDALAVEEKNNLFFDTGTPSSVYPGFTNPTKSKTKFTIDLSPSEETTFGYAAKITDQNEGNVQLSGNQSGAQQLMIYWNDNLKRWEKIGRGITINNRIVHPLVTQRASDFKEILSQSCVGFGPTALVATGVNGDAMSITSLLSSSSIQFSNSCVNDFGFPSSGQYVATSSAYITAEDIGITKPFLLENLSLEFESKFQVPSSNNAGHSHMLFSPLFLNGPNENDQLISIIPNLKIITPTFFLLRQFNDVISGSINPVSSILSEDYSYNVSIPGIYHNQPGNETIQVDTSRELITYGQTRLFLSSSTTTTSKSMNFTTKDLREAGLKSDLDVIKDAYDEGTLYSSNSPYSLTQSFIMNFPVRVANKTITSAPYRFLGGVGVGNKMDLSKSSPSRALFGLKGGRGIVNNFTSVSPNFNAKDDILDTTNTTGGSLVRQRSAKEKDKRSPYMILPKDKLIFGWQYPLAGFATLYHPGNDATALNTMTLFGRSKLHLYGSQVAENKEYHDTLNQNLNTCAVYEHIIGGEKVTDQWQISYRGELSGSIYSQYMLNALGLLDDDSNPDINRNAYLVPYYTFSDDDEQLKVNYRINDFEKLAGMGKNNAETADFPNPAKRITLKVFSAFGGRPELFNFLRPAYGSDSATNNVLNGLYPLRVAAATAAVSLKDQFRIYADSKKFKGDFYDDSTYGTKTGLLVGDIANREGLFQFGTARERERLFQDHYPNYSFSTKHFGHYADMIRQGLDGTVKFKLTALSEFNISEIDELSQPPVSARFVEIITDELTGAKTYPLRSVESYLESAFFQSSNLNTAMTSSMPFIDDDTPKNREYQEENTEVFTGS